MMQFVASDKPAFPARLP